MATQIVREKGQPDRCFPLTEKECLIGRSNDAHLRLGNVSISRFHTRLVEAGEGWEFEDMQSQNGTIVNGRAIERGSLKSGDELFLGKYTIVYLDDSSHGFWNGQPVDSLAPYMGSQYDDEDNTYEISPDMLRQMQAAARRIKGARVEQLDTEQIWSPKDRTLVFGGRGEVPLQGVTGFMSAAEIRWNGKRHVLNKLGWGAVVHNGQKVKRAELEDGDRLVIGGTEFEYILG